MVRDFDVVIAGAGPAGAAAAGLLARRGRSVALLDRRDFPRPKLCGGLLTWKTTQALAAAGLDAAALDGVIDHVARHFEILHRDRLLLEGDAPQPFRFVKRRVLDQRLLDLARSAGAEFFPGRTVTACDPARAELRTARGETFRGRFVLGADGAGSPVRKCLGLEGPSWRRGLAAAVEVLLPPGTLPRAPGHPRLYIHCARAGYGWVFPNSDGSMVGLCGLVRANTDFSRLAREFLEFLHIPDSRKIPLRGHPLPYGNWLSRPHSGRVLLAGDAAGLVEPLFGEGIFYALHSGRLAARALDQALETDRDPAPLYSSSLQRQVLPELRAADILRWLLFGLLHGPGPALLGQVVRLARAPLAEAVHGLRSYRFLRPKTWDW